MDYHLSVSGQTLGPLTLFAVAEKIRTGQVSKRDLVWRIGFEKWLPLGECSEFKTFFEELERPPVEEQLVDAPLNKTTTVEWKAPTAMQRFTARLVDYILFMMLMSILGLLIAPQRMMELIVLTQSGRQWIPIDVVLMLLYLPLEAWMIYRWKRTPGKSLLGIEIVPDAMRPWTYALAFKRAIWVFVRGSGCYIPYLNLFMLSWSRMELAKEGVSAWDKGCGTRLKTARLQPRRILAIVLFFLGFCILLSLGLASQPELSKELSTQLQQP